MPRKLNDFLSSETRPARTSFLPEHLFGSHCPKSYSKKNIIFKILVYKLGVPTWQAEMATSSCQSHHHCCYEPFYFYCAPYNLRINIPAFRAQNTYFIYKRRPYLWFCFIPRPFLFLTGPSQFRKADLHLQICVWSIFYRRLSSFARPLRPIRVISRKELFAICRYTWKVRLRSRYTAGIFLPY